MSCFSSCWFKFGVGPLIGLWFLAALYRMMEPLAKLLVPNAGGLSQENLMGMVWSHNDAQDGESGGAASEHANRESYSEHQGDGEDMYTRRRLILCCGGSNDEDEESGGPNWGTITNIVLVVPQAVICLILAIPIGLFKGVIGLLIRLSLLYQTLTAPAVQQQLSRDYPVLGQPLTVSTNWALLQYHSRLTF